MPPRIRATVVAFYILSLNLIGLGIGITGGGILADYMTAQGHGRPYTVTLLAFTVLSMLAIPLMYVAGKRFHADRASVWGRCTNAIAIYTQSRPAKLQSWRCC